jgi:hypothetical protein
VLQLDLVGDVDFRHFSSNCATLQRCHPKNPRSAILLPDRVVASCICNGVGGGGLPCRFDAAFPVVSTQLPCRFDAAFTVVLTQPSLSFRCSLHCHFRCSLHCHFRCSLHCPSSP